MKDISNSSISPFILIKDRNNDSMLINYSDIRSIYFDNQTDCYRITYKSSPTVWSLTNYSPEKIYSMINKNN